MKRDFQIRAAQDRACDIFRRKPNAGLSKVRAHGRLEDGLICKVSQNGHEAVMDMGTVLRGDGAAPTPGFYFRAALAGCIAIGIKMTAVREEVTVGAIDVDVEMDFDDSAMFGMGANSAAPLETRFITTLQTTEPWDRVTSMVDRALAADPFFLALRDAQKVSTRIVPQGR